MAIAGNLDTSEIRSIVRHCAAHGHALRGLETYDVGTAPYLDFLEEEVLEGFISKGGSTCRFIRGNSGSGKTHILRMIESRALRLGYATAWIDLNSNTNLQNWMLIAKDIFSRLTIIRDGDEIKGIDQILCHYEKQRVSTTQLLNQSVRHPCYRRAMEHVLQDRLGEKSQGHYYLLKYLLGERVTVKTFRAHGITRVKKPLDARNAESVLSTALNCLPYIAEAGKSPPKGTVLLFDESDNTWTGNGTQVEIASNYFRRLIDACKSGDLKNTLAIFGILPTFFDGCASYPALSQRLDYYDFENCHAPWRKHVLSIQEINSIDLISPSVEDARELFVSELADRGVEIIQQFGVKPPNARQVLMEEGRDSLRKTAGEDFRRQTIRAMMRYVSEQIDSED